MLARPFSVSSRSEQLTPRSPKYFKKRVCYKYVENKKSPDQCAGCQQPRNAHDPNSTSPKWDYKTCTRLETTDAYGTLVFPGSHSKKAQYIRIENETDPSSMIEFMYHSEGWKLQKPQLILSVTGGAQKFNIPQRMKNEFKRGLIKAAVSTGAWIITGGTNTGVMRLVGEAVADEFQRGHFDLTVLGIASWGKIALREQMCYQRARMLDDDLPNQNAENQIETYYAKKERDDSLISIAGNNPTPSVKANNDILLDPNHTHFILVDNGSENKFGVEIKFRAKLENELRRGRSYDRKRNNLKESVRSSGKYGKELIPMILIVVNGGPNTLLTVIESLKEEVPVLILAESKGCADLIANACAISKPDEQNLKKLVEESRLYDPKKFEDKSEYERNVLNSVKHLEFIISKVKDNLINVFRLDNEEESRDMELSILRAFLNIHHENEKVKYYKNLKLALQWNRDDIARNDIFTGEEEFTGYELNNLMELALLENKHKFVEIFLENGFNLQCFLTVNRLLFLYNSSKVIKMAKKAPLFQLYKRRYLPSKNQTIITFDGIRKFLQDFLFEDFKPNFLPALPSELIEHVEKYLHLANLKERSHVNTKELDDRLLADVVHPEKNLLVWALLMNRIEIAKIFWRIGEYQISTGLFGSNLLRQMAKHLSDLGKELNYHANEFEEMSCQVLNIFDRSSDDLANGIILLQKIPYYNLDCLQMAVEAECMDFLSLPSVQNLLTDIWNGKIENKPGFKSKFKFIICCLSFGLLAPFLFFDPKTRLTKINYKAFFDKLPVSSNRKFIATYKQYNTEFEEKK